MIIINGNIKSFSKDDLCIITDFDKTITSKDSESTIGVFSKFLPESYILAKNEINILENYLLNDKNIDEKDKMYYYKYIWMLKIRLLSSYIKNEDLVKEIACSGLFNLRGDAIEYINYLSKKYKVIINSSGCGNLIKEILLNNGCDINNIVLFSNFITIDSNNVFDDINLVNPFFKKNEDYYRLTSNVKNCLLIGDTLEDLTMKPLNSCAFSIGFLDDSYDKYLEKFNASFDIVATDNEEYSAPIKKLNL